jgi:glycosyltransferase involved in cell wall biosynthesis
MVNSVRRSLESILTQVDQRFEIIVVDSCSDDGSLDILRDYQGKQIKLIVQACSIGLGRQIAIENSRGKYVISHMDMDDVFQPNLNKLLQIYHANFEGCMLVVQHRPSVYAGIMIAPRKLLDAVGGYKDLNFLEDRDLFSRVAQLGYFRFLRSFPIIDRSIERSKHYQRIISLLAKEYFAFRESFRLGYGSRFYYYVFARKPHFFLIRLPITFWAFVTHWFYPQTRNRFLKTFKMTDYETRIDESVKREV